MLKMELSQGRLPVAVFLTVSLFITVLLWPGGSAYGDEATVRAEGCFLYEDLNGNQIPIRNAEVIMYDYDCVDTDCFVAGPMDFCREEMGRGTTDEDGCFSFEGTGADGIFDLPDPYVQIVADSDAVNVQSLPGINYCMRSGRHDGGTWIRGRREQAPDGLTIDFGDITPSNGTTCHTDCEDVDGEDAAWDIFNMINEGQEFMSAFTLGTNGVEVPKVAVQYPNGIPGSFYLIGVNTIMLSQNAASGQRRHRVLYHEYGHHIMYRFFTPVLELVYPTWDYCNGTCDAIFNSTYSDVCGHCGWRPENEPISWAEGWPHFISEVLTENWGSNPDNQYTYNSRSVDGFEDHEDPGCGVVDQCPQPGDSYEQIEGYVAAILWDLYDDSVAPNAIHENHDSDRSEDRLTIPFGDMWGALFYPLSPLSECQNFFDCIFHDNPLSLSEYWYAIMELGNDTGYPIYYMLASEVYHENHIDAPAPNLSVTEIADPPASILRGNTFSVSDTTRNVSGTVPGLSTVLLTVTRYYLHSGSTMTWNDIQTGAAIAVGERLVPNLCGTGCESSSSTIVYVPPTITSGTYYLHACADAGEVIFENSEDDNILSASSPIQVLAEDSDGDGYGGDVDCDDGDPNVYPGAIEVCNYVDDNCDGSVDEGLQEIFYQDSDADGYGDSNAVTGLLCQAPPGYVDNPDDCDDSNADIYPGATEVCNYVDDNCDGSVDEGLQEIFYQDSDADGYGDPNAVTGLLCQAPAGHVDNFADCDDTNPAINPGVAEQCNGIDDNCDGAVDETFDADADGIADCFDNCLSEQNPDQSDVDGDCPSALYSDDPHCGDVCDICPNDDTDACDPNGSAGESIGSSGGVISTPDGVVTIVIPPGALADETSISTTRLGTDFELVTDLGEGTALYGVNIQPDGQTFDVPISITFTWPDADDDGFVDGLPLNEADLVVSKDGVVIAGPCASDAGCDMVGNTFTVQVSSLSDFALLALNGPPVVISITAPIDPQPVNLSISVSADFTDPGFLDTHTAVWNWGDGTTSLGTVAEADGEGSVSGSHAYAEPDLYTLTLTVTDNHAQSGSDSFQYVIVYDPEGGFVTGGGWIDSPAGAYVASPSLTGKATFGFVSKYKKGANVPTGVTEFHFAVADLNFHSDSYEWLVVAGSKATFKGEGSINGEGAYKFMLSAIDAGIHPGFDIDRFRIRIWEENQDGIEIVIYDNALDDDSEFVMTEIGGGSIIIHDPKKK